MATPAPDSATYRERASLGSESKRIRPASPNELSQRSAVDSGTLLSMQAAVTFMRYCPPAAVYRANRRSHAGSPNNSGANTSDRTDRTSLIFLASSFKLHRSTGASWPRCKVLTPASDIHEPLAPPVFAERLLKSRIGFLKVIALLVDTPAYDEKSQACWGRADGWP